MVLCNNYVLTKICKPQKVKSKIKFLFLFFVIVVQDILSQLLSLFFILSKLPIRKINIERIISLYKNKRISLYKNKQK